ncbi:Com family DNA-binding transcriptional regulator [Neisseria weaveri]|nr:Com family DNA-binding transcriptional regulator [Neisseria weaveri]
MIFYRELRCPACGKLLAKGSGNIQIKCHRCKKISTFR